jgi:hypothetical protein
VLGPLTLTAVPGQAAHLAPAVFGTMTGVGVVMKRKAREDRRDTLVGVALAVGAGLGLTVGVLVGGGSGIAIGMGIGAGLGVVFGASWDALHPSD